MWGRNYENGTAIRSCSESANTGQKLGNKFWINSKKQCSPQTKQWTKKAIAFMELLGYKMKQASRPVVFSRRSGPFSLMRIEPKIKRMAAKMHRSKLPSFSVLMRPQKFEDHEEKYICTVTTFRGIRKHKNPRLSNNCYLMITAKNDKNGAFLSEFLDQSTGQTVSFELKPGPDSRCNTTCDHNVIWHEKGPFKYSMFYDWTNVLVPGFESTQNDLEEDLGDAQQPRDEATVSVSNIAILCLPLLMSLPPISLLEDVSIRVTLWCIFTLTLFLPFRR